MLIINKMNNQSLVIGFGIIAIIIIVIIVIINKFKSKEQFNNNTTTTQGITTQAVTTTNGETSITTQEVNSNLFEIDNNSLELNTEFIKDITNVVSVDKLNNKIINISSNTDLQNKIDEILNNQLNSLIESNDPNNPSLLDNLMKKIPGIDNFPIGTIIMWNNNELPEGNKWRWCDGKMYNNVQTPDLRYRFPLGRNKTNDGNEEYVLPETETEPDEINNDGCITIENIPPHSHKTKTTSGGDHDHGGKTSTNKLFNKSLYPYRRDKNNNNNNKLAGSNRGKGNAWYHLSNKKTHNHGCSSVSHKHTITFNNYGKNKEEIKPFFPKHVIVNYIIKIS